MPFKAFRRRSVQGSRAVSQRSARHCTTMAIVAPEGPSEVRLSHLKALKWTVMSFLVIHWSVFRHHLGL